MNREMAMVINAFSNFVINVITAPYFWVWDLLFDIYWREKAVAGEPIPYAYSACRVGPIVVTIYTYGWLGKLRVSDGRDDSEHTEVTLYRDAEQFIQDHEDELWEGCI